MTSDGTNTYSWDAANRLLSIVYPGSGNHSDFTYDGFGRNVKILEYTSGSLTSTKMFVWCGSDRFEARDSSSTVTAQYFSYGAIVSSNSYCYTRDHLGSVREMTNNSGVIQDQRMYDPFGRSAQLQGSLASDYQFAGCYAHASSELDLTQCRAYDPHFGRFLNRDPFGISGGMNLYAYAGDNPVCFADPLGLAWQFSVCFRPVAGIGNHASLIGNDSDSPGSWFDVTGNPQNPTPPYGRLIGHVGYNPGSNPSGDAPVGLPASNDPTAAQDYQMQRRRNCCFPVTLPPGMTPADLMMMASQFAQAVSGTVPYNPVPTPWGDNNNSNGFARGVLNYLGLTPPNPPGWTPGWDKPMQAPGLPPR